MSKTMKSPDTRILGLEPLEERLPVSASILGLAGAAYLTQGKSQHETVYVAGQVVLALRMLVLLFLMNLGSFPFNSTLLLAAERVGGFKQPTNHDLKKLVENRVDQIKDVQNQYDVNLQLLLWSFYFNNDDFHNNKVDMSSLQKLEWVIETNKSSYQPGEPVGVSVSLRNISTEEVKVRGAFLMPGFFLFSMKVTRIENNEEQEVFLTKVGNSALNGLSPWTFQAYADSKLTRPGDMFIVCHPFKTLNWCYDLSERGEYELTFYTRNFLGSDEEQIKEYPKPCTVRFRIEGYENWLDKHVVWKDGRKIPPYKEGEDKK